MKNLASGKSKEENESKSQLQPMKLSSYLIALRPWSWSVSLIPTLLGCTIAFKLNPDKDFSWIIMILTALTVLCVHGAGNLVNTYYDYVRGIDGRNSDDRTLVDHILSEKEVVPLGAILYLVGSITFFLLAALSPAKVEHLAGPFFCGLSISFLYTGGFGLKYIALGDLIFVIVFGPASVLFAYVSQTGKFNWEPIYYALPLALNTEAILHSNNTRDLESDSKAGIVTLAILIGRTMSHVLYAFLLFTPYIMFVVASIKCSKTFLLPLITLSWAFQIEKHLRSTDSMKNVPRETAKLNLFFGFSYIIALLLTETNRLPFILR
ncbi:ubiA prenyltransferase domain-containing protein 1 homolog [Planococcus citri]|uniref:ubiA prenyltransferase domain-containing protein 1 homolog n=1 Tax=Planococcus citri TaxID=170843 RepID=UPI0031F8DA51